MHPTHIRRSFFEDIVSHERILFCPWTFRCPLKVGSALGGTQHRLEDEASGPYGVRGWWTRPSPLWLIIVRIPDSVEQRCRQARVRGNCGDLDGQSNIRFFWGHWRGYIDVGFRKSGKSLDLLKSDVVCFLKIMYHHGSDLRNIFFFNCLGPKLQAPERVVVFSLTDFLKLL